MKFFCNLHQLKPLFSFLISRKTARCNNFFLPSCNIDIDNFDEARIYAKITRESCDEQAIYGFTCPRVPRRSSSYEGHILLRYFTRALFRELCSALLTRLSDRRKVLIFLISRCKLVTHMLLFSITHFILRL